MACCDYCGKTPDSGNKVSHSNIKTKRKKNPNVQKVRAWVGGRTVRVHVCTRCIRSGRVTKPA